ncbi:MAG: hypothetical protein LAT81_14060, partial [Oceanicaulis sp.]|nr:hypothetical protein [Oceanicaulis sp.]
MEVSFTTNNLYSNVGQVAEFEVQIKGTPAAGQQMRFSWGDHEIPFFFMANPIDDGFEIGLPTVVMDAFTFATTFVIPGLQDNFYINRDFEIVPIPSPGSDYHFLLRARQKGARFNITYWSNIGNLIINAIPKTIGVDQQERPNFNTLLQLYVAKAPLNAFSMFSLWHRHYNLSSLFDLSEILNRDFLEIPLPSFGSLGLSNKSNALGKFYYRYGEAYGSPTLVRKMNVSNTFYFLKGASSKLGFLVENFNARISSGNTLLTHWQNKKTTTLQQSYLTYLHTNSNIGFRVYADVLYTDGTTDALTAINQLTGVQNPSLWVIPTGYRTIENLVDPDKMVEQY